MSYVPELVALYEIFPYIEYLPLNNESIRVAVKDYLEGGKSKDVIIKRHGKIGDWNVSQLICLDCFNIQFILIKTFQDGILLM
jgi:hypothetical protein